MISEASIYQSAQVMIREHGKDALLSNTFWVRGDDEGASVWMRIVKAVEELHGPPTGQFFALRYLGIS
jgi:hypothetical protein